MAKLLRLSGLQMRILLMAVAVMGLFSVFYLARATRTSASKFDCREILQASEAFKAAHQPAPESVTFSQLIQEGYLRPEALNNLHGREATLYFNAHDNTPQRMLMDVEMPDRQHIAVLADGSVQQLTSNRWQQLRAQQMSARP